MVRKIITYKNYFADFYKAQDKKIREKVGYVLDLVRFERQVPEKFFKSLKNTDGIYEVRVLTTLKSIRILCFFDDGNLIVLANCFVKKTEKGLFKRQKWLILSCIYNLNMALIHMEKRELKSVINLIRSLLLLDLV